MLQYTGYLSTMIGILIPLLLMMSPVKAMEKQQPYDGLLPDNSQTLNNWITKMRQWELEQTIRDPEFDINNALAEFFNGSDGSTESEELLQLPSGEDRQSGGWGHDRCDHRSWFRFIQKRTGKDCGS
mgnify:CR=1 FL=1